jgi:aminocarboxymuconate-semialdehyde decarboxylase
MFPIHRCCAPAELIGGAAPVEIASRRAIDIHAHMFTPEVEGIVRALPTWPDLERRRTEFIPYDTLQYNAGQMARIQVQMTDSQQRLEDMDRMGIERQAVTPSPTQYYYWVDRQTAERIVTLQNEAVAKLCASNPTRFIGMGTIAFQFPDLACKQLQDLARLGLRGIQISTQIGSRELADPSHEEVWSEVERLQLAVFIHPLGTSLAARVAPYYLSNIIGQPIETTIALSHIIFSGLLERRPNLKICAAHGGGYLPAYFGRTTHGYRVRPECHGLPHEPSVYLRRMYFDSLVYSARALRALADEVGTHRIVVGTDYPFDMGEYEPVSIIEQAPFSDAQREDILRGNALRLLGLS